MTRPVLLLIDRPEYRSFTPRPRSIRSRRWWCAPVLPLAAAAVMISVGRPTAPPSETVARPPAPLIATASHSPMPSSCAGSSSCLETVAAPAGWKFTVYRNFPMSGSAAVTRAVIVVHGTGRNAGGYFASVAAAAQKSGVADRTMVIAPWFKTAQDSPAGGEATWSSGAWKIGESAQTPSGLSSFLVMDQLIATLADRTRFPNLRDVVVTGHSAGGQFTQRYAALGLGPNALPGVHVTYVPANPSSYLYFTPARPSEGRFDTPSDSSCSDYDTYKYGLQGRNGYPATLSASQALSNYTHRTVTVVNGGADTFNNGDMDSACGAMLEGPNRAARGANYVNYIHSIAPEAAATQRRIVVNGVDHDGDVIFNDPAVRSALFGTDTTSSDIDTDTDSAARGAVSPPSSQVETDEDADTSHVPGREQ